MRHPLRALDDNRVRFLLVGGLNTIFATALFAVLLKLFGPTVPAVASLCLASATSLLSGFLAHRHWVFKVEGSLWLDLVRYTGVNYMALLFNIAAMALLADAMGLPAVPVQIGIIIVTVCFNYFGHKHFSFRRQR